MFTPTFLYIKRHTKTGKMYFGKTTRNVHTYLGSGKHWVNHIRRYGKEHVETVWFCLYTESETLYEQATSLSKIMDITNSSTFLNLQDENGLDGMPVGTICLDRRGKSMYKDREGKIIGLLPVDHPQVLSGEYVGCLAGTKMSEESKKLMKKAKDPYRTVRVFKFDGIRQSLSILESDLETYQSDGWALEKPIEYTQDAKQMHKEAVRLANTGTASYYYPKSGILYGRIPHDSPIIKELGLVHKRSEKQKAQASEQAKMNASNPEVQEKKSKIMGALSWFYNPHTLEKARLETCPEGWLPGRKGSTTLGGTETWNDGVRNYRVKPGTQDPSWERGMVKRKKV